MTFLWILHAGISVTLATFYTFIISLCIYNLCMEVLHSGELLWLFCSFHTARAVGNALVCVCIWARNERLDGMPCFHVNHHHLTNLSAAYYERLCDKSDKINKCCHLFLYVMVPRWVGLSQQSGGSRLGGWRVDGALHVRWRGHVFRVLWTGDIYGDLDWFASALCKRSIRSSIALNEQFSKILGGIIGWQLNTVTVWQN